MHEGYPAWGCPKCDGRECLIREFDNIPWKGEEVMEGLQKRNGKLTEDSEKVLKLERIRLLRLQIAGFRIKRSVRGRA